MPVLLPSGVMQFSIGDLDDEVILRLENRVTDIARADVWLRDALVEFTSDPDFRNEFDQLEEYGPPQLLTGGSSMPPAIQEYQESYLVPVGDYNLATLDILIWQDPGTNKIRRNLTQSHYQKADRFQPSFSLPTEWYRFGSLIGFTPIPDKNYQVQVRLLRQHPINDANLAATALLIPRDWNEILIWSAVQRGFMELLEFEKANIVYQRLHGDPKYPNRPGLFEGRKKRREMEGFRTEAVLRPMVRPYMRR